MYLQIAESDVIVLSIAAACLVAAVVLELLRLVLPDIYEWAADHAKVRAEIGEAKRHLARTLTSNREQGALRDRRNAERFRLKSQLSRTEMALAALERDRIEVWHELGEPVLGDQLYVGRVGHRQMAATSHKDFDSAPVIWRYGNGVRIWAAQERAARARLHATFPAADGYSTSELTPVPMAAPVEAPGPQRPGRERAGA